MKSKENHRKHSKLQKRMKATEVERKHGIPFFYPGWNGRRLLSEKTEETLDTLKYCRWSYRVQRMFVSVVCPQEMPPVLTCTVRAGRGDRGPVSWKD